jgi:DNA polymerase-3 subunit gamma/tau
MLSAAAGLAYKHRDKLTALIKRDGGQETGVSALPPGTQEPPPRAEPAGAVGNWASDPAQTAATPDAERDAAVAPEAAEEPSPWVSPKPPSEEQPAAEEPTPQPAPAEEPTASPEPAAEEPSPWVSPQPPNEEQAASPPDPRTQEPPGSER